MEKLQLSDEKQKELAEMYAGFVRDWMKQIPENPLANMYAEAATDFVNREESKINDMALKNLDGEHYSLFVRLAYPNAYRNKRSEEK